jgi:ribosome assembly protein 1
LDTRLDIRYRLKRRLERNKASDDPDHNSEKVIRDFDSNVETGFQLATFQGPLCAEPVEGMAYFVEKVEIDTESLAKEIGESNFVE